MPEKEEKEQAPAAYREFRSHVEKLSFDHPVFSELVEKPVTNEERAKCQQAADIISYQLLGILDGRTVVKPDYYNAPEFAGKTPIYIEREILREQMRDRFGLDTRFGVPAYIHGLRLMKMMFPKTDITPVLADIVQLSFLGYTHGRKYLHLLGSMDAGKSSSTARLMLLYMFLDAENTFGIVANPLLESADMTIYGDIAELYGELCEAHPQSGDKQATSLFPHAFVEAKRRVNFIRNARGKGGWVALRSLQKEGVAIGAKGKGKDDRFGVGLFIFDEINKVQTLRFKDDLVNVSAQAYFQMHSTQNPRDELDIGGQMATPKKWLEWGWSDYKQIQKEKPVIWPTVDSGIAYRINGLDAVNIRREKVVYPYQFNTQKLKKVIEDKGENSWEYFSQVLGIFPGADSDMRLLSEARMDQSRYDDEHFAMKKIGGRVMFCDPAHTGDGDNAVIGMAEFGPGIVTETDSSQKPTDLFVLRQGYEYVKYIKNIPWRDAPIGKPEDFTDRFIAIGGNLNHITPGKDVSFEQQIALHMAELAKENGIEARNIGYDFSMRPDMVEAVNLMLGPAPVAFNYNTPPIGYQLLATNENTADKCRSRIDELACLVVDVLRSKQLRGGKLILTALIQLGKTRILSLSPKLQIEKKKDYKARNGGKSPDERDVTMGLVGMAFLRGFRAERNKTPNNQTGSVYEAMKKAGKTGRRLVKKIRL